MVKDWDNPRLSRAREREIEDSFTNDREPHTLLDLINAEFQSDPLSTQWLDSRIVERVRMCVAKRKAFVAKNPIDK